MGPEHFDDDPLVPDVLSNLWTLIRMGSNRAEAARKLEVRKVEEREK